MVNYPGFDYIERQIRKKIFGVLGTVDNKNGAHCTGIMYGVAPKDEPFALYLLTGAEYKKTRNIRKNPNVSFAIPFPHHWLRFIPDYCIQFQGKAEILPVDDPVAVRSFQSKYMLRENLKAAEKLAIMTSDDRPVFLRITPRKRIHVFGVGISLRTMLKNIELGAYSVTVPEDRRSD
ncbi:MAG: pyridoxamine 5'-phosphate oxidase family protein [Candidatus Thorarchaeota archaeon]